jgi:phage shock protein PspC (stress-responsive transcriptional regulator)
MKKVININFQGRVIPIEETAFEILKQYIESLRRYFSNEEGRDEIVNDIESRIAELFSEQLQKGATCITDDHVNAVIASMGRPEDFAAADEEQTTAASSGSTKQQKEQQGSYQSSQAGPAPKSARGRLFRNADDKIIGGVCSGLANYFGIDPVILRIVFVVFFAALFWVYVLLWVIVPSQSVQTNITRRLYRSADDKVLGGVCGGLAAYFNIDTWIPRLIFALPLILGLISGTFNAFWWDWDFGFVPRVVSGSLGSTLFITYVILWIAVPVATTAAEKLEMKGEKVDLNSIRNTVKEDLESFKTRTEKWSSELKQSAQQFGTKAREFGESAGRTAKTYATEVAPMARQAGSGIGHVIGVLFKAFFLFIAGIIAISLFGVFLGFLFGGFAVFPMKNFLLDGAFQNLMAWSTLLLFLGVPIVAIITWLVRRIMGVRSKNHYLGYVFGGLWFIGVVCAIVLAGMLGRNFKTKSGIEEKMTITQPRQGKLYIDVERNNVRYYGDDWFGIDWDDDMPFYGINPDTLMMNTVRVNVVKSKDSFYHVYKVRFSRGNNPEIAKTIAGRIEFNISQQDSMLLLPKGFAISKDEKFRNQQVLVVIEVPVGKRLQIDNSVSGYDWFNINFNRRRGWNTDWDDNWDFSYGWNSNVEYIMTPDGLERTDRLDENELRNGRFRLKTETNNNNDNDRNRREERKEKTNNDSVYRYNGRDKRDSSSAQVKTASVEYAEEAEESTAKPGRIAELSTPLAVFTRLLK